MLGAAAGSGPVLYTVWAMGGCITAAGRPMRIAWPMNCGAVRSLPIRRLTTSVETDAACVLAMRRLPVRPAICKRGHPLDYQTKDGRRGCRTCRYEGVKRWRLRLAHGIPEVER